MNYEEAISIAKNYRDLLETLRKRRAELFEYMSLNCEGYRDIYTFSIADIDYYKKPMKVILTRFSDSLTERMTIPLEFFFISQDELKTQAKQEYEKRLMEEKRREEANKEFRKEQERTLYKQLKLKFEGRE